MVHLSSLMDGFLASVSETPSLKFHDPNPTYQQRNLNPLFSVLHLLICSHTRISFCGILWRHRATIQHSIPQLDAPTSSWISATRLTWGGVWQFVSEDQTTNSSLQLMNFYIFYSFTSLIRIWCRHHIRLSFMVEIGRRSAVSHNLVALISKTCWVLLWNWGNSCSHGVLVTYCGS
jgi:hypothetical protein